MMHISSGTGSKYVAAEHPGDTLESRNPVVSSGGGKALRAQQTVAAQVPVLELESGVQGGGAGL